MQLLKYKMKKEEDFNDEIELEKTISSFHDRTSQLINDKNTIDNRSNNKHEFWSNQKVDIERNIDAMNYQIKKIKFELNNSIILSEKIITEFRNKVKSEQIRKTQEVLDMWQLENFVTYGRFKELLKKEMLNKYYRKIIKK